MPVGPVKQLAPVYRYYTADLLTGEILSEVPFRKVTYEKALKAAGAFRGEIPVIDKTKHLDLYENTIPGKTALYVVRDGVCVWGGIIWTRSYNVVDRVLSVTGTEFTSYLYHRRIWKTWSHQYEAQVIVDAAGVGYVTLVNGSTTALNSGTSVHLEFYESSNYKYNGFYTVASEPAPSLDTFQIDQMTISIDIEGANRTSNVVTVSTVKSHGLAVGDVVTIAGLGSPYDGQQTVTGLVGVTGDQFTFASTGSNAIIPTSGASKVTRQVPANAYGLVTVSVRTDTFEYMRSLLSGVFSDFVGIDFPNVYIEPGLSFPVSVTNAQVEYGKATITTALPHNLAIGQAVQLQDVSPLLDGEYTVTDTPSPTSFKYVKFGSLPSTAINITKKNVTAVRASGGKAFLYTATSGMRVGQHIKVDCGLIIPGAMDIFSGGYVIESIDPGGTWLSYSVPYSDNIDYTAIPAATATVSGNVKTIVKRDLTANTARITTTTPHGFSVGNTVTVQNLSPKYAITEKTLDAGISVARIATEQPHQLQVGDYVTITGLQDASAITQMSQTTTQITLTTQKSHNFRVGDSVVIENLEDKYTVSAAGVSSNIATLTTTTNTNLSSLVGNKVVVDNIYEYQAPTFKRLSNNVATITTGTNHNYRPNTTVTVSGITDTVKITSASVENGVVVLNTADPHNFFESDEINVNITRTAAYPFNGKWKVLSVTDYTIHYEVKIKGLKLPKYIAPTKVGGTATSTNSIFNGEHVVESATANTFSFSVAGNDVATSAVSSGSTRAKSFLNGEWTTSGITSNTISFNVGSAVNVSSTSVILPPEPESGADRYPPPSAAMVSQHNGTKTITKMSRNTISFLGSGVAMAVKPATGSIGVQSFFNGVRQVTSVTRNHFTFALGARNNIFETTDVNRAYAQTHAVFNGAYVITAVPNSTTFHYARTHNNIASASVPVAGTVTVDPVAIVSSFGPYPGNSDIGIKFSTRLPSGIDVPPPIHRGFELTNVGEAMDSYSDSLGGFEYRIDSSFNPETNKFDKTFVFIPIDFEDPPAAGEISPVSRFGADRLVFEYPGNVVNVTIEESAENSSTRFFAVGETDLGPDAGPPFSVAASTDLLNGTDKGQDYRKWPLLDDDEKIDNVDDEAVLYSYANRYLNESLPPDAKFNVQVNGSLQPVVGSYSPGDWCSVIVNDDFILMRLRSDLEPRDDVLVRKIDSLKVTVPDGTTFPERVDLVLVPEWDVDKRGQ